MWLSLLRDSYLMHGIATKLHKKEFQFSLVILECLVTVMSESLQPFGLQHTRLLYPWDFSGKNTGVGCHFLLQGIIPSSGTEPAFPVSLVLQADFLPAKPLGKPLYFLKQDQFRTQRFCFQNSSFPFLPYNLQLIQSLSFNKILKYPSHPLP